jgi:single-strand DNA-binding protein
MASFNKVILAGNLTRDPELRYTPQGRPVARIGLAVNRSWTTETGEKREEVSFIDVDAWGKQAETLSKFMRKGRPLLVEGRLKMDTWEDKNTHQKQSKLRVVLESFSFIDSRPEGSGAPRAAQAGAPATSAAPVAAEAAVPDGPPPEDDDVPF